MKRSKRINILVVLMTAFVLTALLFSVQENIFAAAPTCSAPAVQTYEPRDNGVLWENKAEVKNKQEKFAAAQMQQENNPPPNGSSGSDSKIRSDFSYFASIFFLFVGIWVLFSLLKLRWKKNNFKSKSVPPSRVWNIVFNPSFALSAFALMFAAIIIGSVMTAPRTTSAQQNRRQTNQSDLTPTTSNGMAIVNQPVFKSARAIGGDGITQIGEVVFDYYGNYYVRGGFSGTMTFGNTTLTATYDLDMFVAKYDANGKPLWARQGIGPTNVPSHGLAIEGATALTLSEAYGAIYVAGSFAKTITLQGGNNPNITLTDDGGAGYNYESFIAKYDLDGNLLWARGGNTGSPKNPNNNETGQNTINKIVVDASGNPFIAGTISGSNFLGSPISNFNCSNNQPCVLNGSSGIILAKLAQDTGAPTTVTVLGGSGKDNGIDLAIDNVTNPNSPKLYLVGSFTSSQIVLPNGYINPDTYDNPSNALTTFIVKFDMEGDQNRFYGRWNNVLKSNGGIIGVNQIATDQSGYVYMTGYFTGTIPGFYPNFPGDERFTNTRTGTGDAGFSGYVTKVVSSDGSFFDFTKLGGPGNAMAFLPNNRMMLVGRLYDTGTFGTFSAESYGATDVYIASLDLDYLGVDWVKMVNSTGDEGGVAVADPTSAERKTVNRYIPLGVSTFNYRIFVTGDFQGTLSLDCLKLTTPGNSRQSYIAEVGPGGNTTNCRVWTNRDTGDRVWTALDNWNDGIIPAAGDSVYVPYRKYALFNPVYKPSLYVPESNVPLGKVIISDNQTIELQEEMTINDQLDLLGGRIDTGTKKLNFGAFAETSSSNGGRVIGKVEKLFFGQVDSFTFPVGTANGYSPVTLSNVNAGKGARFAVTAHEGAYPYATNNLPANRANRWWNLTNDGLQSTDLTFQYLPEDITAGTESAYRAYRIPTGGGTAVSISSTVNTITKTVNVPNVSQFSDWTLAQPLIPTAADVNVGGRVLSANGNGIANARINITDASGNIRTVLTNSFGYYNFRQLEAGSTYILTVKHKRYTFLQPTQILSVLEDRDDINFTEIP